MDKKKIEEFLVYMGEHTPEQQMEALKLINEHALAQLAEHSDRLAKQSEELSCRSKNIREFVSSVRK